MSAPAAPENVPKAILYFWPDSVWSTVPRLCLEEKGYSEDEYVLRMVDISKGENFNPSYLKINMNGTIPTLVVPTYETTGQEVDTRFRSLRDTISICDFLDQARNSHSSRTVSDKPAPALAPATIEGKAISDELISIIHEPTVDPNFLSLACRTSAELQEKKKSHQGKMLVERKEALNRYIAEASELAAAGPQIEGRVTFEQKTVAFLKEKAGANDVLYDIYQGTAGAEREKAFYDASTKAWTKAIPVVFQKLDFLIKGPYALGDQVSLADFHVIAWLARIVMIGGGDRSASAIDKLEEQMGIKSGPKLRAFWAAWVERPSFKNVYPQALH